LLRCTQIGGEVLIMQYAALLLLKKNAALLLLGALASRSSAISMKPVEKIGAFPLVDQILYDCCVPRHTKFVEQHFTNYKTGAPFRLEELMNGHGEAHQDLFLYEHVFRYLHNQNRSGPSRFVEFGGRDGSLYSNTMFFERNFGWEGVLIEAMYQPTDAKGWHGQGPWFLNEMHKNRNCKVTGVDESACIFAAVSDADGDFLTVESRVKEPGQVDVLDANGEPVHASLQPSGSEAQGGLSIPTVTLDSIMHRFNMEGVDLMSMDCEGCEQNALRGLDLAKAHVSVILLERNAVHDYCSNHNLLRIHGYFNVQGPGYDEVYIHPSLAKLIPKPPKLPFERANGNPDKCPDPMAWAEWPGPA